MGGVFYELLTGEELFRSETVPEKVALVLKNTPDFDRVPPKLRRLLESCLERIRSSGFDTSATYRVCSTPVCRPTPRPDFKPLGCRWEARNTANDARIEDQKSAN
jgi:hypothetical protein